MRNYILLLFTLALLVACSDSSPGQSDSKSQALPSAPADDSPGNNPEGLDRPAPPITQRFPPISLPGYEQPRDAGIFSSSPLSGRSAPSVDIDLPQEGEGEFASSGWQLPSAGFEAAPSETLPQIKEEEPQVPRDGKIIPHDQVIEDIPQPINIVEDIP